MHQAVAAERWTAIRALREGEPPTFTRLAAAVDLHPSRLRDRALVEGWKKQNLRDRRVRAAWKDAATGMAELAPFSGDGKGPASPPALEVAAGEAPALEEQLARLGKVLSRQLDQILSAADAAGGLLTKAQTDALAATMRLAEKFGALATESVAQKQKRSDEELAEILWKVDRRILELAGVEPMEVGEGQPDA